MDPDFILNEALKIANGAQDDRGREIQSLLEQYPDGAFLFIILNQDEERGLELASSTNAQSPLVMFIAESFRAIYMSDLWDGKSEEDEE